MRWRSDRPAKPRSQHLTMKEAAAWVGMTGADATRRMRRQLERVQRRLDRGGGANKAKVLVQAGGGAVRPRFVTTKALLQRYCPELFMSTLDHLPRALGEEFQRLDGSDEALMGKIQVLAQALRIVNKRALDLKAEVRFTMKRAEAAQILSNKAIQALTARLDAAGIAPHKAKIGPKKHLVGVGLRVAKDAPLPGAVPP